MNKKWFLILVLGMLLPGMGIYSQNNSVIIHGGYDITSGGDGSNLSFDYYRKLSKRWSLGSNMTISNTYNRKFVDAHESRGLQTFMDTRFIRSQGDLMADHIDPEIVFAYENYGLVHTATKNEYNNQFLANVIVDYDYRLRSKWILSFGFGVGVGVADRLKNMGGRAVGFVPFESMVDGIEVGSVGFQNRNDFSRVVKYLFWNSVIKHKVAYTLSDRLSIVQLAVYQFDFPAATGLGGGRRNLTKAGLLQLNLGVCLKI